MTTETVQLTAIKSNDDNPRNISGHKLDSLIDSILIFPKMLTLRPIVADKDVTVLGGNMRLKALEMIAELSDDEITERFEKLSEYAKKSDSEQKELLSYWSAWKEKQDVEIVRADKLSEQEQNEFIIKDNIAFGVWDYGVLDGWDSEQLAEWGLDVSFAPVDINIDGFFDESTNQSGDKKPKMVTCPHCGKEHEI